MEYIKSGMKSYGLAPHGKVTPKGNSMLGKKETIVTTHEQTARSSHDGYHQKYVHKLLFSRPLMGLLPTGQAGPELYGWLPRGPNGCAALTCGILISTDIHLKGLRTNVLLDSNK